MEGEEGRGRERGGEGGRREGGKGRERGRGREREGEGWRERGGGGEGGEGGRGREREREGGMEREMERVTHYILVPDKRRLKYHLDSHESSSLFVLHFEHSSKRSTSQFL